MDGEYTIYALKLIIICFFFFIIKKRKYTKVQEKLVNDS